MEKYDYEEAIKTDIADWLEENGGRYAADDGTIAYDDVYDDLFISDSVTGNGSGSYTFNTWTAEENLCHNLDLLRDAIEYFGGDYNKVLESAEGADVTIRCHLLSRFLQEKIDEYNDEHLKEEDEEEEEA
jgi:hypothetical protein